MYRITTNFGYVGQKHPVYTDEYYRANKDKIHKKFIDVLNVILLYKPTDSQITDNLINIIISENYEVIKYCINRDHNILNNKLLYFHATINTIEFLDNNFDINVGLYNEFHIDIIKNNMVLFTELSNCTLYENEIMCFKKNLHYIIKYDIEFCEESFLKLDDVFVNIIIDSDYKQYNFSISSTRYWCFWRRWI